MKHSSPTKKLVILDAHALIHRSYHALPSFASASGEPMGAVYGVSAVLLKLLKELKPTHIVAAFDREEPTFRHIAYEQYKATRAETKSDLVPQFNTVKELFKAFGIPIFEVPGFEADDIIGTLVDRFAQDEDCMIVIASGDMDTLQLVDNERIVVYTLRKGIEDTIIYDEKKVEERFGFAPHYIPDFKGLKGDPSDNIIGVKGIGDKTATQLIKEYGTIEELYARLKKEKKHPPWLTKRVQTLLLDNEEEALFSKELAKIRRDTPIEPALNDLVFAGVPRDSVAHFFRKFHFPSLVARLESFFGAPENKDKKPETTHTIMRASWDERMEHLARMRACALFLNHDELSIGDESQSVTLTVNECITHTQALEKFFRGTKDIVAYDAKAISHILPHIPAVSFDITLAAWLLDPERKSFLLSDLMRDELPSSVTRETDAIMRLEKKYRARLAKEKLEDIYFHFELPLIPILASMEKIGIRIDQEKLKDLRIATEKEIAHLEKQIHDLAGESFDINSPKQLSRILFEKLLLPTKGIKKTSTKAISTQFSELVKLRDAHPIIDFLMRFRELSKLASTYITVLPTLAKEDGRVHTTFHQTGTATGRLSSSDPNLQNIPVRTERGREVRSVFIADAGYELVSFDYSQLELRIAASLSRDEKLCAAFHSGDDIHTRTAAVIFHVEPDAVTSEMRRRAKTINFGILYGMGARALAQGMKVSQGEAEEYLREYLRDFPGIETYRERVVADGRANGFVMTLFGRRRYIPNLRSSFEYIRGEAERMAMNAPIQGTEADLLKRAMIRVAQEYSLGDEHADIRLLLQVHDELLFEIKKENISLWAPRIKKIMEDAPELSVPIIVDVRHGLDWQNMKKIEDL